MKLISEKGHFATKDNSMIFSNIVWLVSEGDSKIYHLIDEDGIEIDKNMDKYLQH